MNVLIRLPKHILLASFVLSVAWNHAFAFKVMASLNTYKKSRVTDAIERVDELHADGAWFIVNNSDFTDNDYQIIFNKLGGTQTSEDNPNKSDSYDRYVSAMGEDPYDSFCYNETGGTPGGTLLSNAQINTQYASHGNRKILCLTRAYVPGPWKTETDRCLANNKVEGIVWEPTREAAMSTVGLHNGGPQLIAAAMAAGKKCYILLHGAGDGWSDADNMVILNNLNSWAPAAMATDNVIIVYQNYDTTSPLSSDPTGDWLSSTESVKSAIKQAKAHPNYTGNQVSFTFGDGSDNWDRSSSIEAHAYTAQGELLVRAAPNSDPFIFKHGLSFNGSTIKKIRVRIKAEQSGIIQFFWGTTQAGGFSANRVKSIAYPTAYAYQELVFDMSNEPDWIDKTITSIRVDTTAGSTTRHTWFDYVLGVEDTAGTTPTFVSLRKRDALGFAIDCGGGNPADNDNVYMYTFSSANDNQQWEEISRGNDYYSYVKKDTIFAIDGGNGGGMNQNVRLLTLDASDQNQHWKKVNLGNNYYRLEKRNAAAYSIDGSPGGANMNNVRLRNNSDSSQSQHWRIQ